MTVAAGRMSSVPLPRWLLVLGALFAVTFGGPSCGDGPRLPVSLAGHGACPNVVLQASLPAWLVVEAGVGALEGGAGPGEPAAGACLFVVVALAGLATAAAVGRPLLVHAAYWWARLRVPLLPSPVGVMRMDVLLI